MKVKVHVFNVFVKFALLYMLLKLFDDQILAALSFAK